MAYPVQINVWSNIREIQHEIDAFAKKQLPYATSLGLTMLANKIKDAETKALSTELEKKPTPFTKRAFGVVNANKRTLTSEVYAKDIQAKYLAPSEFGGNQILGSRRGLPNPKDQPVNQYGNLPRKTISRLSALGQIRTPRAHKYKQNKTSIPTIYFGKIKTKEGMISGIWQRDLNHNNVKLLIRWADGTEIRPHLEYHQRAAMIVAQSFDAAMTFALARAMKTAK